MTIAETVVSTTSADAVISTTPVEPVTSSSVGALTSLPPGAVTSSDSVLALYAPTIPGSTPTIYPPFKLDHPLALHCCLSIDHYHNDLRGQLVVVDPWFGIAAYQSVVLVVNGITVDSHTVQPGEESQRIGLYIKPGHLSSTADNEVKYVVTRTSGNEDQSASVLLRYQEPRVGGVDRDPFDVEQVHSELYLELPADVIKNGIDANLPEEGVEVTVTYPLCRAYDMIKLNCNGKSVEHLVVESEAGKPVKFKLKKETFVLAGDHEKFLINYSIEDQCRNRPQPPPSAGIKIDVDLAGKRLLAPILREDPTDDKDDPLIIDLGTLGANNLSVIILTGDPRFMKDDRIIATYVAKAKAAGQPDVVVVVEGTVEMQFGQKKPCILEIPNDKVVSAQTVTVTYELKRNDMLIATSKPAEARVIGVGLPELKKPTVQKTVSNELDPLDNPTGANGRVEVVGWKTGDKVRLIVDGAWGAGSPVFAAKPLNINNRANFALPVSFIIANMGGLPIEVYYKLIRDGREHLSFSTFITVSKIKHEDSRLPTPAIDGVVGNELDVTKMLVSDQLRVGTWPLQQVGQRLWLRYDGFDADGKPIFLEDLIGAPNDTVEGLTRPAPLDWLKTLKNGSALTITFMVNFDGVANKERVVRFPLRTYTIKSIVLLKPVITSIKDSRGEVGATLEVIGGTDTSVTVTGTATANSTVELFDNGKSKGEVPVGANKVWSKSVAVTVGPHRITAIAKYGDNPESDPRNFNQKALWNFAGNALQGWAAQGVYVGHLVVGGGLAGSQTGTAANHWRGMIMARQIPVQAGKTYKFTYRLHFVRSGNANVNGTTVALFIGNAIGLQVGVNHNIVGPVTGSGQYKATVTGNVALSFYNYVANHYGNDFRISNITMEEAGTMRGLEIPEGDGIKKFERFDERQREEFKKSGYTEEAIEALEKQQRLDDIAVGERIEPKF